MKNTFQGRLTGIVLILAFAAFFCNPPAALGALVLGTATDFAVLGASTVTNTGSTILQGSLGLWPGTSITGFLGTVANDGPGMVQGGTVHETDAVAQQAQSDALIAYNTLKNLPSSDLTGQNLGTVGTLGPGVYRFDSSALLTDTGTLTLDFSLNPGNLFVFQVGTELTTAASSSVNVINGDALSGVYWLMGTTGGSGTGSATLGASSVFAGNILALDSISFGSTASIVCGRAIALNGAVTMIGNNVSNDCSVETFGSGRSDFGSYGFSGGDQEIIPEPQSVTLAAVGLLGLILFRWQSRKRGRGAKV